MERGISRILKVLQQQMIQIKALTTEAIKVGERFVTYSESVTCSRKWPLNPSNSSSDAFYLRALLRALLQRETEPGRHDECLNNVVTVVWNISFISIRLAIVGGRAVLQTLAQSGKVGELEISQ